MYVPYNFTALLSISLLINLFKYSSQIAPEVTVPIDELPPSLNQNSFPCSNKDCLCLEQLGCLEKLPLPFLPQDPYDIGTKFGFFSRAHEETVVPFEKILHITSDGKQRELYPFNLLKLIQANFDPKKRTIIITGGYRFLAIGSNEGSKPNYRYWQVDIMNKWLLLDDVNVILVTWPNGNWGRCHRCASNTRVVGRQIAALIYYLYHLKGFKSIDEDTFLSNIYLIGHSLGAHISGFAGQDFRGKIGRITGLDPAGPYFQDFSREFKLDSTNAIVVDVIHTNAGLLKEFCYGHDAPLGHLDYYVNDGKHQPDCRLDLLGYSHQRAIEIYHKLLDYHISSNEPSKLIAYTSECYREFSDGTCLHKNCPETVRKDIGLNDLNNCIAPIDFVKPARELRQDLQLHYNFNFDSSIKPSRRLYFSMESFGSNPDDVNMLKIRLIKDKSFSGNIKEFQFHIKIFMVDKKAANKTIYVDVRDLRDQGDYYEAIVPYTLPCLMDTQDLDLLSNTTDGKNLIELVEKNFPSSLVITSNPVTEADLHSTWLTRKLIKKFRSHFQIALVTLKPLKLLSRPVSVIYTKEKPNEDKNFNVIIVDDDCNGPPTQYNNLIDKFEQHMPESDKATVSKVSIDTLIIGSKEGC